MIPFDCEIRQQADEVSMQRPNYELIRNTLHQSYDRHESQSLDQPLSHLLPTA